MKNWLVLLLLLILPWMKGVGQCPISDLSYNSQYQIDRFPMEYPNCTDLLHSLTITGSIRYLDSLKQLKKTKSIIIEDALFLENINGLNQLTEIGDFVIKHNKSLNNVFFNGGLKLMKSLKIESNDQLKNIELNDVIKDLSFFRIDNNPELNEFIGLKGIEKIKGAFELNNCKKMNKISIFDKLKEIEKGLIIQSSRLDAVNFFPELELTSAIKIQDNSQLIYIDFPILTSPSSTDVIINFNNSLLEINLPNISSISTLQLAYNMELFTLGYFSKLTSLKYLILENNSNLADLTGISHIDTIISINIWQNKSLTTLKDLKNLQIVLGDITISSNLSLVSLFEDLTHIEGSLNIVNNPELTEITGFHNIDTFGNYAFINNIKFTNCAQEIFCKSFENSRHKYFYANGGDCKYTSNVKAFCDFQSHQFYPNPAHNTINFTKFPLESNATITVYDIYGRREINILTTHPEIDISTISNGTYILEVKSDKINYTKKFVKY